MPARKTAAREYQATGDGAYFHATSQRQLVPGLAYDNLNNRGVNVIKFDLPKVSADGRRLTMTDRKNDVVYTEDSIRYIVSTLDRTRQALRDNPNVDVHYEFPTQKIADKFATLLESLQLDSIITIRVSGQ